jgi:ParB family chromosome partitioning protein
MTVKRSGLGRNLSALLGQSGTALFEPVPTASEPLKLAITCLQPGKYQPRGDMDSASLDELAHSIKNQGILQPLLVRELEDGRYEIIAGERRWRASQIAGLNEVPVLVKSVDDETAMAMALIENLQREDLNAMDEARAMQRLTNEFSLTHQQIADLLSKSRTAVSNYLRLLSLADCVKKLVEHGDLDMGHARALLVLDQDQQTQAAQLIVAKNLSVREAERLVARLKAGKSTQQTKPELDSVYEVQLNSLAKKLQTRIKMHAGKKGTGSLVIHYESANQLDEILLQLMS